MTRRRKDLHGIDTSLWPRVDTNALPLEQRTIFGARQRAIDLYVGGESIRLIEEQTGINRRQLYFLLDRCLMNDVNGRVIGYPGLVKYKHFATYTRTTALKVAHHAGGVGLVGAFSVLLERYPVLATWINQQIRDRTVILRQISTNGVLKTRFVKQRPIFTTCQRPNFSTLSACSERFLLCLNR